MDPVSFTDANPEERSGETILYRAEALRHRGLRQTEEVALLSAPRGVWTLFWILLGATLVFAVAATALGVGR
jgi:hypothetical protein